jgi:nitroreductase/NAD-dependent dihydropyrimidine dehydrogenase PreA subunit
MIKFEIDRNKCVKCGLCIQDCITGSIEPDSEGFPQMTDKNRCINCQHCFSVCPNGAVKFDGKSPENSDNVDYNNILSLIKSRKSVRQYKQENVSEEKLNKLKSMLHYVPTGCNSHSLHFSIVEDKDAMEEIRDKVNSKLLNSVSYNVLSPVFNKFSKYKDALKNGEDIIFRNAPHMIVASSPITAPCANIDPVIALAYFELYAHNLGLGTCWCGFAQMCIKMYPEVCNMLQIPDGYVPVYAMLFGEPAVKYQRTIQPEPYKISSIKEIGETKDKNLFSKTKRFITNFLR